MSKKIRYCPHCGCVLVKPRSPKHHRLFFSIIDYAFDNWPHSHEFEPRDSEHLRAWLLVQVGHRYEIGNLFDITNPNPEKFSDFLDMCAHEIRIKGNGFPAIKEDRYVEMVFAKSISWDELDEKDFRPISEAIFDIITCVTKLTIEEIVNEIKRNKQTNDTVRLFRSKLQSQGQHSEAPERGDHRRR